MTFFIIPIGLLPKIMAYADGHKTATDDELTELVLQGKQALVGQQLESICTMQIEPVLLSLAAQKILKDRYGSQYVENITTYGTPFPTRIDIINNQADKAKN